MSIPGVNDDDFRLDHFWCGPGQGSRRVLTHVPSGVSVSHRNPADSKRLVPEIYEELRRELEKLLIAQGVIPVCEFVEPTNKE